MKQKQSPDIFWFTPNKKIKWFYYGMNACFLIAILAFIVLLNMSDKPVSDELMHISIYMLILLSAIISLGNQIYKNMINKRLGISGRLMIIEDQHGNAEISPIHQSYKVANMGILVNDSYFTLGNEHKLLSINKREFEEKLVPALKFMNVMGEWGYFKYRMANMNKSSTLFFTLIVVISILAIYGYFVFDTKPN